MPLAEQRYQCILNQLAQKGSLRTSELATLLEISEMTIRRDLAVLEKRMLLKRIHGGAILTLAPNDAYGSRDHEAINDKDLIANYIIRELEGMVENNTYPKVVYLDSGTTAMAVARALSNNKHLPAFTLVLHGVNLACYLANNTHHRLHLVGGEIYQSTYSTFGNDALKTIDQFHFDLFLLGASGFNDQYFTNTNYVEIGMKKAVLARSQSVWLMLDSSKWQQSNFAVICDYNDINKLFLGPLEHPNKNYINEHYPHLKIIHCA